MGHITLTFKLHRPGAGKRKLLDDAMSRYSDAFHWLTVLASGRLDEFPVQPGGGKTRRSAGAYRSWVDTDMSRELNRFRVEPFKDALKNDFSAQMAGYLSKRARMPETRFIPVRQRSLLFCRYDTKRDWCLAYNPEKDRFFAKLYLTNRDDSIRNAHAADTGGHLVHVHRDRTPLSDSSRMIRYLVLPLEFGSRQEAILKEAILQPERFRSARLIKREEDYYLIVSMETESTVPKPSSAWIGFSRAMDAALSWTVSGPDAKPMSHGILPVPAYAIRENGEWTQNGLHHLANEMVRLAAKYNAKAVIAPLSKKGDHLHWVEPDHSLTAPQVDGKNWNRILALLRYKLVLQGLEAPVSVSPHNMFRACPCCGMTTRRNRMSRTRFLCIGCGHTRELDEIGSLNLSGRLQLYERSPVPIAMENTAGGIRFRQSMLELDVTVPRQEGQGMMQCLDSLDAILEEMVVGRTQSKPVVLSKLARYNRPIQGVRLVPQHASAFEEQME